MALRRLQWSKRSERVVAGRTVRHLSSGGVEAAAGSGSIQAGRYNAAPPELRVIDLDSAGQKSDEPGKKDQTSNARYGLCREMR